MSAVDILCRPKNRLVLARLDTNLPIGIHQPQKHGDVGWDLEAMETTVIPPMQAVDVKVNVRIEIPDGCWAECRARSSLARRGLQVDAGTIDQGYRGPLYVLIRNMNLPVFKVDMIGRVSRVSYDPKDNAVTIGAGERVGQLVFYRQAHVWATEVDPSAFNLQSDRGEDGFGSTGR